MQDSVPYFLLTCAKVLVVPLPPQFKPQGFSQKIPPFGQYFLTENFSGTRPPSMVPCTVSGNGYAHQAPVPGRMA